MIRILLTLIFLAGCPNQVSPIPIDDAGSVEVDGGAPDGGVVEPRGLLLEGASLAPAARTAETDRHRITGRLKAGGARRAESSTHVIRGGLVPSR